MKKRLGILVGLAVLVGVGAIFMTPRWRNVIWGYLHGTSLPYWQEALKDENAAAGEDAIAAFAKTGSA